jgi:hypothetical protein
MQIEIGGGHSSISILKDIVVPGVQILAPFLAAVMILIQIRHNSKKDREKLKFDLQTKFYNEIEEKASIASQAVLEAHGFCNSVMITCNMIIAGQNSQFSVTPLDFNRVQYGLLNTLADLIITIEKYEIVLQEITIFKSAFSAFSHDLHEAIAQFYPVLLNVLPYDVPMPPDGAKTTRVHQAALNATQAAQLLELKENFEQPIHNIGGILSDLRVEFQNVLLGPLFKRKLPPRQPLDPDNVVVRTDPASIARLTDYFDNHTPWGKNIKEINRVVAERFAKKAEGE